MSRQRTGALLIPEEHLEKHRRRFPHFKPVNAQVLFAVRALAQRVDDDATERLSDLGLTARQYNYLSVIYVEENVTPNEIGTLIHSAPWTVIASHCRSQASSRSRRNAQREREAGESCDRPRALA